MTAVTRRREGARIAEAPWRMMMCSLFDIQVNGFAGVDFQQPALTLAGMRRAVAGLARHDTHRFFATLITDTIPALRAKLENLERLRGADPTVATALCGYHLEGPWLSTEPGFCGAHDPRCMAAPDFRHFEQLQTAANGHIRLVTLAPELPGSADFIRRLSAAGVRVSLGHTNASEPAITAAIAAGAQFCTHLGNGTPVELHRHDNVIQRLLARDELTAFFIPDGVHLRPSTLQNFFRAKPAGKALFTTDCMAAAGAGAGRYRLGHLEVEVAQDRIVRLPGTRQLAGSALCPDEGVANVQRWLGLEAAAARAHFSTLIAACFNLALPDLPKET